MANGRKTGGRKAGTPNRRTAELAEATASVAERLSEAITDAFTGDAHAYMMSIYKDPAQPVELRLEAAKAAARFEKPALQATRLQGDEDHPMITEIRRIIVTTGVPRPTDDAVEPALHQAYPAS